MTTPALPICTAEHPSIACDSRRKAQRAGEFWYHVGGYHPGWKWSDALDRANNRPPPLVSWHFCPWCGGDLPSEQSVAKRIINEDGG
jgi:hypothetical protein